MDEILYELAEWNPSSVLQFKWTHSYDELIKLYKRKQKIYFDRTSAMCKFLIELTQAALGGKKPEEEIGLDNGEGLEELTEEQIENLKAMLGADFYKQFPQFAEDFTSDSA